MVIDGRLSACPIAKRGRAKTPAAAAPIPSAERRDKSLIVLRS
jgi:hypothetical protein